MVINGHWLKPQSDGRFFGGLPKKRLYSRLNWLGLSYPTSNAALAASNASVRQYANTVEDVPAHPKC
jgi:hypothetical protein